jgi:two-component system sensor histidine kinase KdpD
MSYHKVVPDERPNPDLLLAAIQKEDAKRQRGALRVFFGMAAGVGKTYAMLEAAQKQKAAGCDIVIAYVETHGRHETDRLTEGLPMVPRKQVEYRGVTLSEMDLDAVLARHPRVALVDELAHTNVPGSRHVKRYQDVQELLEAGIDVYTTLNVQHVASRADTVRAISGAAVQEVVPDTVLDAAEIELIDIAPEELLKRLDEGKVYLPDRAEAALFNFFREGNLTALREMALRLTAERVGQDVRDYMQAMQISGPWKSGHRLLVAVSPSPLSAQLVGWTRRLADSLDCPWVAVYVEIPRLLNEPEQTRLTRNLALARELGAEVITTTDADVVRGILRVARQHNVTQIVVGKSGEHPLREFLRGGSILHRMVRESGDIDIHVVRAEKAEKPAGRPLWRFPSQPDWRQYLTSLGVVAVVGLLNALLDPLLGHRVVGSIFLMTVVGLALFVGRGPVVAAATLSALIWNYFFLPPRFTLRVSNFEDVMMLAMYFVVALVLGQLIARIRTQEQAERVREERAIALYLLTRELADAASLEELVRRVVQHVTEAFKSPVAVLLAETPGKLAAHAHPLSTFAPSEKEQSVAAWVFQHKQPAGKLTDNLPLSEALYLPLTTSSGSIGVVGIRLTQSSPLSTQQRNLLDAFTRQIALALDRHRLQENSEKSKVLAESERLSKTLLNSISHEMRTPIAAITSAASSLGDTAAAGQTQFQQTMVSEIQEAARRLNRLVGNLLDMSRLESGHVKPSLDWCDVSDLVNVALRQSEKELAAHHVTIDILPGLPLVKMDFVLMQQALTNLLLNAAVHTPPGTDIQLKATIEAGTLLLSVSDRGPGLPAEDLTRVFEKFYRAPAAPAGGTGLGLSIVKGFVEAQGGDVRAENRPGGGAAFTLRMPLNEPPPSVESDS